MRPKQMTSRLRTNLRFDIESLYFFHKRPKLLTPNSGRTLILVPQILWALGSTVLFCSQLMATTIVAVWTPRRLVVVADSVVTGSVFGSDVIGHMCKIRQIGRVFLAASGAYESNLADFNLWSLAEQSCSGLVTNVDRCAEHLKNGVVSGMKRMQAQARSAIAAGYKAQHLYVSFIVIGLERDSPELVHWTFYAQPNGPIEQETETFKKSDGRMYARAILGNRIEIDQFIKTHPRWRAGTPEEEGRILVKIEADAFPEHVGPPFSILTLDRRGAHWVDKGCCSSNGCNHRQ